MQIPTQLLHTRDADAAGGAQAACPVSRMKERLRGAGLRPTRQRMLLGWLLFQGGNRHVTADLLFQESQSARARLSLATVYNTLSQFADAGLLRRVAAYGERIVYDTHIGDHHHFLIEDRSVVLDIPDDTISVGNIPEPPAGYRVAGVDVVVRLEPIEPST